MKKRILILAAALLLVCLAACSNPAADKKIPGAEPLSSADELDIVCTIFPQYDWVRQIVGGGDRAELTLLLDSGVDLHNYQPTADDMIKISGCDLFIYVGGESDGWVDDALKEAVNKDMVVINLMDVLANSVKEEEVVEGMQAEEEEAEEAEAEAEPEYDEHVWLSLKNASVACAAIADAFCQLDPANADAYRGNCDAYIAELNALDVEYQNAVDGAPKDTLLFGDRFPFRYLADDYGLNYYAAFVGCSAETEAAFETVIFLAQKLDELNLPVVLVIENSDRKIAQAVIDNTEKKDQPILVMDSMQSVTAQDVEAGKTYLAIMRSNLDVLRSALD